MKQFFILGRNPELSRAEIFSYLEARKIDFSEIIFKGNFLILEFDKDVGFNIQDFGGVLKLGKISFEGNQKDFVEFLYDNDLYYKEKFKYSVFGNLEDSEEFLKEKFKSEKRKAVIRHGRRDLKLQDGEFFSLPNSDVEFFCFHNEKDNLIYFGVVQEDFSHNETKKRDTKKPVIRESLAISPRLAKILINLAQARKGNLLLDPFCGVGGILQEALVQGINVVGIDKDSRAIENAMRNLKWLNENFEISSKWELIKSDSSRAPDKRFDAIACEPQLGPLVKKKPKPKEARDIIREYERIIIPVLRRMRNIKKINSKIALTMPFTDSNFVNIERICNETGLSIHRLKNIKFPIKEFRKKDFISREVVVLV